MSDLGSGRITQQTVSPAAFQLGWWFGEANSALQGSEERELVIGKAVHVLRLFPAKFALSQAQIASFFGLFPNSANAQEANCLRDNAFDVWRCPPAFSKEDTIKATPEQLWEIIRTGEPSSICVSIPTTFFVVGKEDARISRNSESGGACDVAELFKMVYGLEDARLFNLLQKSRAGNVRLAADLCANAFSKMCCYNNEMILQLLHNQSELITAWADAVQALCESPFLPDLLKREEMSRFLLATVGRYGLSIDPADDQQRRINHLKIHRITHPEIQQADAPSCSAAEQLEKLWEIFRAHHRGLLLSPVQAPSHNMGRGGRPTSCQIRCERMGGPQ